MNRLQSKIAQANKALDHLYTLDELKAKDIKALEVIQSLLDWLNEEPIQLDLFHLNEKPQPKSPEEQFHETLYKHLGFS